MKTEFEVKRFLNNDVIFSSTVIYTLSGIDNVDGNLVFTGSDGTNHDRDSFGIAMSNYRFYKSRTEWEAGASLFDAEGNAPDYDIIDYDGKYVFDPNKNGGSFIRINS